MMLPKKWQFWREFWGGRSTDDLRVLEKDLTVMAGYGKQPIQREVSLEAAQVVRQVISEREPRNDTSSSSH